MIALVKMQFVYIGRFVWQSIGCVAVSDETVLPPTE